MKVSCFFCDGSRPTVSTQQRRVLNRFKSDGAAFAFVEWNPLPPQFMQPANSHFSSSSLWIRADLPATTHTQTCFFSASRSHSPLHVCVRVCTCVRARMGFLLRLSRNVLRIPLFQISPVQGETGRKKKGDQWRCWWWWWALVQAKSFPL